MTFENLSPSERIQFFTPDIDFKLEAPSKIASWLDSCATRLLRSVESLEYVFCTDDALLEINKEYLQHDYYTDIITFPLQDSPIEGLLYISIDRVRENALELGYSFKQELHRVMVHGLLHLMGYDDKTDVEKSAMREMENECLQLLKL